MEAIILAGGFGTRLKSVLPSTPKPIAPIANTPFLLYLIKYLRNMEVKKLHISLHHDSEKIIKALEGINDIEFHIESLPLGTGGAVLYNLNFVRSKDVLILNGDVFSNIDYEKMLSFHVKHKSNFTIASIHMENAKRFGCLEISPNSLITEFKEKGGLSGFINAGCYIAKTKYLTKALRAVNKKSFSIEKDFFETGTNLLAFKTESYFIDIGIPEDYERAQAAIPLLFDKLSCKRNTNI